MKQMHSKLEWSMWKLEIRYCAVFALSLNKRKTHTF